MVACNNPSHAPFGESSSSEAVFGLRIYRTFEEAMTIATDVVVAEYIGRSTLREEFTKFEFIVHERIFGDAADRIFVVARSGNRQFVTNTHYLLALDKIIHLYSDAYDDQFFFVGDLILDLNNPQRGTMNNEPLTRSSSDMNFNNRSLTRDDIILYVTELTRNNIPANDFIRSDDLVDIIGGSPYVLVVEINEPWRLSRMDNTDVYYATVVEVIEGDKQAGDLLRVIFFAGTVFPGETHIISIEPDCPYDPYFHTFTSRHSLHTEDQLPEIRQIIADQQMYPYLIPHTDGFIEVEIRP